MFQPQFLDPSPYRPFVEAKHTADNELYRLMNPIVEENGIKKFKLEFDARRFKPEDVRITTNSQTRILTIEAKKQDENSRFEYCQKVTVPVGVNPQGMNPKIMAKTELCLRREGQGVSVTEIRSELCNKFYKKI